MKTLLYLACLLGSIGLIGCGADRFDFPDPSVAQPDVASAAPCPPEPPKAEIPDGFVELPLPPRSVVVEPAAAPPDGSMRVDLRTDLSVREAYDFYLEAFEDLGIGIAFTEFEGIDAEVFGSLGDDVILARVLVSCGGRSAISITAQR